MFNATSIFSQLCPHWHAAALCYLDPEMSVLLGKKKKITSPPVKSESVRFQVEMKITLTPEKGAYAMAPSLIQSRICWTPIVRWQADKAGCCWEATFSEVFFAVFGGVDVLVCGEAVVCGCTNVITDQHSQPISSTTDCR